jgi:hypothetical protein
MLAIHKEIKQENDNFWKLANYIKDLKKGEIDELSAEKLISSWHDGCMSDNFQVDLKEIELTQLQNTRSKRPIIWW